MFPFALAALLAAAPAAPDPEITVQAGRLTERQIEAKARDFVRDVLPVPAFGQYARWTHPVCPKVTGIADVYAAMVETRVRAAAIAAGAPLARPGCRSNLAIHFSEDARATVGIIARRAPKQVARLDSSQRDRLLNAALPVRWWHVSEPTDGSGGGVTPMATALISAPGADALARSLPLGPDVAMTNGYTSSFLGTNLRLGVTSAVVLVDIPLATGKPLDAVADYVALVALAPARLPPEQPGVPSIIGLFGNEGAPKALTDWDKAYLAALYRMQLDRSASVQRGQLITGITTAFRP